MSPADAITGVDWAKVIRTVGITGVALLLAILLFKNDLANGDAYTKQEASARAHLVDSRMDSIEKKLDRLVSLQEEHAKVAMHSGSAAQFAELRSDMRYLVQAMAKVERHMEEK